MGGAMDRRGFLTATAASGAVLAASGDASAADKRPYQEGISSWPLSLNTSTIRPASLKDKIRVADEAGYDALELWITDIEEYAAAGGDVKALGREIKDRGMFVVNMIGLWDCMPEGEDAWKQALEVSKRRMAMSADAGSRHIAVLPLPDRENFDMRYATDRYRELLRLGVDEFNIVPAFEFVGFFKGVTRLGQAALAALDADHEKACIIPDTFHLYRGGSGYNGIKHLQGHFIASFHWNDVPDTPGQFELADEHRIYPGDGILPLEQAMRDLNAIGYAGPLSLEMFNREHWAQDPLVVCQTGIRKLREQIARALA